LVWLWRMSIFMFDYHCNIVILSVVRLGLLWCDFAFHFVKKCLYVVSGSVQFDDLSFLHLWFSIYFLSTNSL
jgi:hypothetical protein